MLIGLSNRFTEKFKFFGYNFIWRCTAFYFPLLDGTDPRMDRMGLVVSFSENMSNYSIPYLVEIFPELDFILGSSYNVLRGITKS